MRLKRLELFGFKSFADRTVFEFGENTLTGVVGPNGCGKSNVVDSVRWVLGEQRPTSMRGAEMTDVIFKGSASRPGLAVAEVTLILDNHSGILAGRGGEVGITRRVFKSGEGEYLLDGQRVRLKDVREMLFDTGLGSRGYSVLEQGKIDAVLSANPLERRRIFEEAAGISRYRQRKVETELRLKRVADDMARLADVIGELESRVRSLKIQAGKAERFVAARDEWSRERTRAIRHRVHRFESEQSGVRAKIAELEQHADALRAERAAAEAEVGTREREHRALASELERLVGESARLAAESRALDERRAQASERIGSEESAASEERRRAEELSSALAERAREMERLAHEIETLARDEAAAREDARVQANAVRAIEAEHVRARAAMQQANETVLGLLQRVTEAQNRARSLEESRTPAAERGRRLAERLATARAARAEAQAAEERAESAANGARAAQSGIETQRRELAQRLAEAGAEVAQLDAEKNALELERTRLASRIEFLLDRERDLEEIGTGGRQLFEAVARGDAPCPPAGLLGLAADLLRTDSQHARALDAVLAARPGALIVSDAATARALAQWLMAREAPPAGLLLPQGLAQRARTSIDGPLADVRAALQRDERVIGFLHDHVRAGVGAEPLCELLCGDVVLARDLSAAIELVGQYPGARCATLDGELVDAAGLLGGHRSLAQGAVGRRSSADDHTVELEAIEKGLAEVEAERADRSACRVGLQKDWERSSHELEQRRQARAQLEGELATAKSRARDLDVAEVALQQDIGAAESEAGRLLRELEDSQAVRTELEARFDVENAALAEHTRALGTLEAERERLRLAEREAQVLAARQSTELSGRKQRHADLVRRRDEGSAELAYAERRAREHAQAAADARADVERLATAGQEILETRGRADERALELRRAAEAGQTGVDLERRRAEAVTQALERASAELADQRLADQRLALSRDEIVRRAHEELALGEAELAAGFEPEPELEGAAALAELESAVRELKAKLDKLGPVNLEAMSELDEVGGRLSFLTQQHKDLTDSRDALAEAVRTIDTESRRLFLETFETVRVNFQRIFRQLFGGGRADVLLEEGADVLDAGVEIVARPPGRELLSIGLLSGGQRTLTALALLFAVFEARPSPFCILDEVDAALDDANVQRFLAMLEQFRATTQFVVVTHNKGTMASCESLYGVTMETKGVSRQVAVELAEADRWSRSSAPAAAEVVAHDAAAESRAEIERAPTIDRDSGEPVVELVPARLDAEGVVHGGTARRRAAKADEATAPVSES
ncbi:MAG: chromosome segregation protein SMC [Planctomycetota bacterium]